MIAASYILADTVDKGRKGAAVLKPTEKKAALEESSRDAVDLSRTAFVNSFPGLDGRTTEAHGINESACSLIALPIRGQPGPEEAHLQSLRRGMRRSAARNGRGFHKRASSEAPQKSNRIIGLGLPWFLGAVYWAGVGATDEWKALFGPGGVRQLPPDVWNEWKDSGAFVVESGDLGLSVIVFTLCAVATISLILVRRKMGRQELGGNKMGAIGSASFLVMLWFIYIIVSCLATYGFIA